VHRDYHSRSLCEFRQTAVQVTTSDIGAFMAYKEDLSNWNATLAAITAASVTIAPFPAIDPKTVLLSYSASARFNKETGGATYNGIAVATDRDTQAKVTGAAVYLGVNSSATFQWKLPNGTFTLLNGTQVMAMATAIAAHVQACFAAEATLAGQISTGTVTTTAQIDSAFAVIA
jgi:hypothetical protein